MTINYQKFTSIVFIDSKVDNYQSLIAGIAPEAKIVLLNPANDGIKKITERLKTANYQEVHLIAHGSPGCVDLGNSQLNLDNLDNYASELQTWFHTSSLIPRPSYFILLYGCNVAAGDAGAELITQLKQLTGAEIAATSNLTGNKTLGGDWELEVTTSGDLEVNLAIEESVRQSYQGVLTSLIVTTADDEDDGDFSAGDLSLREAVALANQQEGAGTITFDSDLSGGTITFNESLERDLIIDESVSIVGLGQDNLTLEGGFIFNNAQTDTDLAIDGLNITGGKIDSSGNLTLTNSTISETISNTSDNSAIISRGTANISDSTIRDNSGGANVGILIESGTATIEGSTIANNDAPSIGIAGVIIRNEAMVDISNSTIANNSSRANAGIVNSGTANVTNTTIVNNNGGMGIGGVDNFGSGVITLTSSIAANNTGVSDGSQAGDISGGGEFISGGNNLIGNGDDATGFVDIDIVGTTDDPIDPLLGELQDNGGATQTIALQEGSPAIDAGSNPDNLETDQRGEGFNRTIGNGTDIGAFEVQNGDGGQTPTELVVSTLEDENDGDFSAGDLSLREAVALANQHQGADTITFDSDLSGGTITFNESLERDLIIDESVSIVGLGQDNLTLDGGFIFNNAQTDTDLAIDGLNIIGGKIDSSGNLTLSNSTISETIPRDGSSDNSALISRGTTTISDSTIKDNIGGANVGILIESGTTTIEGSTVANNDASAFAQAGIIVRPEAKVDISNSTIANNRGRSTGGIENAGTVNITNSTIANNTGGLSAGGINNFGGGFVTVTSSILANNFGGGFLGDISGDGEFISGGNNLISNGDDATGFVNGVNGDLVGSNGDDPFNPQSELLIDAQLGELQDNGGATPTIELLEGSPAIDAGSNPNNLETDQRGEGFNRTIGNGTDIGAYEVQNVEDLYIRGTNADDILTGGKGNDTIKGRNGADSISGGEGNDLLNGGKGDDTIHAGSGDDTVSGSRGDDSLTGEEGNDLLNGGKGDDTIHAGSGDDIVSGGRGNDLLVGGDGNDILNGNRGRDIFVLQSNQGEDTIVDFSNGHDLLGLSDTLSFDNLSIVQNDLNTSIHDLTNNNETLATLVNVNAADINAHDFTTI